MSDKELVRKIIRLGKKRSIKVRFESRKGKGSHGRLYYGDKWTTATRRGKELSRREVRRNLGQIGLSIEDLDSV